MTIFSLVAIALLVILVWRFGDVLLLVLLRFAAFATCITVAYRVHEGLAEALVELGVVTNDTLAEAVAFLGVLLVLVACFAALGRALSARGRRPTWSGLATGFLRAGLVGAGLFLLGAMLFALITENPVRIPLAGIVFAAALSSLIHSAASPVALPLGGRGSSRTTR